MTMPILTTKLYHPPARANALLRPRLVERLSRGLRGRLSLICAPAGFGKTTLVSAWAAGCGRPVAWLSLEQGESDPGRFLSYLVAALQTVASKVGAGLTGMLRSPQPPPPEAILTALLNEISANSDSFLLVLDDYHVIDSAAIDQALTFLIEHMPPQMHLAIITREDPRLPLARLRARHQLSELRVADLRFTRAEAAAFLGQVMGLRLSSEEIAELEARTEGWAAGLQLAALSLQGQHDAAGAIRSFGGSHHFVLDYLVEEVLQRQPAALQSFLLRTAILERMCGPLCDALLRDPAISGQATLEQLERANLFIIPLDNQRRWYRYHHLFADLLRQRLGQSEAWAPQDAGEGVAELHRRASAWYEQHGLELEAFRHAAAANDIERAERLIEGKGMPLQFRGALAPVLSWLASLPTTVLDARPSLWVTYASVLLATGQSSGIEQRLQAAEAALQGAEPDDKTRDLIGRIAATRATLAASQLQLASIVEQSRRALEYLHHENLPFRTSTLWKLGLAYQLQGERAAASQAYDEVIAIGQASGNIIFTLLAMTGLGTLQELDNLLYLAAETYQRVLELAGELALPAATSEAQIGLARICYEWNDLEAAQRHAEQSLRLARQIENTDRVVGCELFIARLKLAQGDAAGSSALVARASQLALQHNFVQQLPEVIAAQVRALLRQGDLAAAAQLAQTHPLPISQARVQLAQGDAPAALATLEPPLRQAEAKAWHDQRLKLMVLQALALQAHGAQKDAIELLGQALPLAEPGGLVRLFLDEGPPMAQLLSRAAGQGRLPAYGGRLLALFAAEAQPGAAPTDRLAGSAPQPLVEPLTERELEVLQLIAQGLSNHEIGARLFLALSTVKGHNQRIFDKLQVKRRTEALARARELGLL